MKRAEQYSSHGAVRTFDSWNYSSLKGLKTVKGDNFFSRFATE
jgi:hypothetical protein